MEISPVKAPLGSAWAFWPYTGTRSPSCCLTTAIRVNGGAMAATTPGTGR